MKHGIGIRLLSYGLRVSLLLLALTAAAATVFGSPDTLKTSLKSSGTYQTASDQLSRQAGNTVSGLANLKVDKATVEVAAQQSFSPQTIETNTESAVDELYGWLQGKTEKPIIKLDLSPYVDDFVQSVGNQAEQRVAQLPACTAEQLRQINPNTINIYELPCRPPGVDLGSAKQVAINQAVASNDFLQNPVLSSDSLPKDANGKTALDRASSLPTVYQWAMRGPWIFGGMALLCAALIVWLLWSAGWRAGAGKLARSFLGVGITLLVITALAKLFFHFVTDADGIGGKLLSGDFQHVLVTLLRSLERAYDGVLLNFGIIYIVVALITLIVIRLRTPGKTGKDTALDSPVAGAEEAEDDKPSATRGQRDTTQP
jgi:hypothetical protein